MNMNKSMNMNMSMKLNIVPCVSNVVPTTITTTNRCMAHHFPQQKEED
jgi:hypothetical protein